jgi:hypothetical protein
VQNEKLVRFHSFDLQSQPASFLLKFDSDTEAKECVEGIKNVLNVIS